MPSDNKKTTPSDKPADVKEEVKDEAPVVAPETPVEEPEPETTPDDEPQTKEEFAQDAGVINTTDSEYADELPPVRTSGPLTDEHKTAIVDEFNGPNASVAAIAGRYDVTPEQVFAIVDEANKSRKKG